MTTLTIRLPRPHQGQRQVIREARRFNVLALGRRFGKTTLGQDRLLGPALEGYPVAWFSPSYKMLTDVWREVRRAALPVTTRTNAQEHRLELVTGGLIDMWSLDQPDAARGRKYKRIVVDEAAMIRHLQEAWTAVIRPTLTDFAGDAWFLSTPKGRNYFHTLYRYGQHAGRADWMSWRMPTITNPFIRPSEVEAARLELPERIFAQEYLAEFLEFEGAVFRRVMEAATAVPQDRATAGHQYVIGADWGKLNDFTALSVVDTTTRAEVALERFNQIDYAVQLGRLRGLCQRFQPTAILAERNSIGEPVIEQAQREGLPVQPFVTTNATKAAIIEGLALAFERDQFRILPDETANIELLSFVAERTPSGLLRYGAPDGQHDDTVIARALAWHAASTSEIAYGASLWS